MCVGGELVRKVGVPGVRMLGILIRKVGGLRQGGLATLGQEDTNFCPPRSGEPLLSEPRPPRAHSGPTEARGVPWAPERGCVG